jgi:hypothetical protein
MKRTAWLPFLAALVAAVTAPAANARGAGASPLDGTWSCTWTRADLLHAGILRRDADELAGRHVATFANGHVTDRNLSTGRVGTSARFFVHGSVVGFVFPTRGPGIVAGRTYELKWSLYRDRLRFAELPGRSVLTALPIKPWTRVR